MGEYGIDVKKTISWLFVVV